MPAAVVRTASFDLPAADLWRAVADPALLERWLAPVVDLAEVRTGAVGRLVDDEGVSRALVVDRVVPGSSLTFVWAPEDGSGPSVVEVRVVAEPGERSSLTVVERALVPGGPDAAVPSASLRGARWDARLDALGELLGVLVAA